MGLAPNAAKTAAKGVFVAVLYMAQLMILRYDPTIMDKSEVEDLLEIVSTLHRIGLYPTSAVYAALPENLKIDLFVKLLMLIIILSTVYNCLT